MHSVRVVARLCAGNEHGHGVDWAYLHPPEVLRGTKYMHLHAILQRDYKETQPMNETYIETDNSDILQHTDMAYMIVHQCMRNYALNSVMMAPAASARAATSIAVPTSGGGADDPDMITTGKSKFPDGVIFVREIEKPSEKLKSYFSDGAPPGNNCQG
jgi:hypothetical protein